ncbi:MAG: hypothetical protein HFJ40_05380 [Clostridia bacterium]|nr:hypothetical protein [Clostridia bacterium]
MNKNKKETKIDKLEFNTYCIFTEEKQCLKETIGLIFKDYIRKSLSSGSKASEQQMPHAPHRQTKED